MLNKRAQEIAPVPSNKWLWVIGGIIFVVLIVVIVTLSAGHNRSDASTDSNNLSGNSENASLNPTKSFNACDYLTSNIVSDKLVNDYTKEMQRYDSLCEYVSKSTDVNYFVELDMRRIVSGKDIFSEGVSETDQQVIDSTYNTKNMVKTITVMDLNSLGQRAWLERNSGLAPVAVLYFVNEGYFYRLAVSDGEILSENEAKAQAIAKAMLPNLP